MTPEPSPMADGDDVSASESINLRSFATVTHELRSPLHAILGLSEVLAQSPLSPADQELVASIHRQASAMQMVVDDLLDLSKIGAGKFELIVEPLSPRSLIGDIEATFASQAAAAGLSFDSVIDDGLPRLIRADGHRIRQVLVNLVSNAIKYTETGSVTLHASAPSDKQLRFTVVDTGPGIAPDVLPRLFNAFEQQHTTDQVKGTGLGLSITRQLIELMGGTIEVESSSAGTVFDVTIPVEPARRASDFEEFGAVAASGAKVLVVDDTDVNRLVASSQLDRLGHCATEASNGEDALELLRTRSFDLVLLDWHMPGIDGLEVISRYLAHVESAEPRVPATPIVMMTASVSDAARAECLAAGASGFLPKPVSLDDLSKCVSSWLTQEKTADAAVDNERPAAEIDRRVIDRMVEDLGGPTMVQSVIATFALDVGTRRDELRSGDIDVAARAAHTLKSTTRMLGAVQLSDVLGDIESELRTGSELDPARLDAVDARLEHSVQELNTITAELAA